MTKPTTFQDALKDKIIAQDFGVPDKYAEYADNYAAFKEAKAREECAKIVDAGRIKSLVPTDHNRGWNEALTMAASMMRSNVKWGA